MVRGKTLLLGSDTLRQRLKKARKEQGLSARSLSLKAGLSPNVVQMLEEGDRTPGVDTAERLAIALGVSKSWLLFGEGSQTREELSYWVAPDCDPLNMVEQLRTLINGPGGHIEQSYKYLDVMDAANWRTLTSQSRYAALVEGMPLEEVAAAVLPLVGPDGLDVIGLGIGTGRHELRLVSHLVDRGVSNQRLFMLDISQPLLNVACRQVKESLAAYPDLRIVAINGDFFNLPNYEHIFRTVTRRRRLWSMFGYTFGNLDNEIRFVRNSLTGSVPGDLLLIDVPLALADPDDPEELRKHEPGLAAKRSPEVQRQLHRQEAFNLGPIQRYAQDLAEVEFEVELDKTSCVVAGSYAIQMVAQVVLGDGTTKSFSLGYIKRYNAERLATQMRREGWDLQQSWSYGNEYAMVCLFRKLESQRDSRPRL